MVDVRGKFLALRHGAQGQVNRRTVGPCPPFRIGGRQQRSSAAEQLPPILARSLSMKTAQVTALRRPFDPIKAVRETNRTPAEVIEDCQRAVSARAAADRKHRAALHEELQAVALLCCRARNEPDAYQPEFKRAGIKITARTSDLLAYIKLFGGARGATATERSCAVEYAIKQGVKLTNIATFLRDNGGIKGVYAACRERHAARRAAVTRPPDDDQAPGQGPRRGPVRLFAAREEIACEKRDRGPERRADTRKGVVADRQPSPSVKPGIVVLIGKSDGRRVTFEAIMDSSGLREGTHAFLAKLITT
jgi:hypothetical protein